MDPDLTLIFDMDPAVALERGLARNSGEDRFEEFGLDFQIKLRAGFLKLAQDFPDRCHVIDASRPVDDVFSDVMATVQAHL